VAEPVSGQLAHRQLEGEAGAGARLGSDLDASAVELDDLLHDGQSDTLAPTSPDCSARAVR
jgi:hypothetical protein